MNKVLIALREATLRLIAENPAEITVHRVEYVDDGVGGRMKREGYLPPFAGRLVPSRQAIRTSRDESGGLQTSAWMLIAPWTTDLRAGSDVLDAFEVNGQKYQVARVTKRTYQGETIGFHASLEEVS